MIKALVFKELRENAWIAATALALYLALVYQLIPREKNLLSYGFRLSFTVSPEAIPFVSGTFASYFSLISFAAAIGLGFRQSTRESGQSTYLFLLHRPWLRDKIFLTKLGVGSALLLGCGIVPIIEYAWWAATPGDVAAPFDWSMTMSEWVAWANVPLAYLAAFLSGLRPARSVRHAPAPPHRSRNITFSVGNAADVHRGVGRVFGHGARLSDLPLAHHPRSTHARLFVGNPEDELRCDGSL